MREAELGRTRESGTVLGYRVGAFARDWPALETAVPALRARHPAAPVILHIGNEDPAEAIHYARRAAFLYVRAILIDGEDVATTLRSVITQPVNLAGDVIEWLEMQSVPLPPEAQHLVRAIVHLAPRYHTVRDLLESIDHIEEAVRKRFHHRGIAPPSRWFGMARALHAALALQRAPNIPLFDAALDLGYSDHSALSRQMLRIFGLRPSVVRTQLGWEGLMVRWLEREAGAGARVASTAS